jgi:hypothetical protein
MSAFLVGASVPARAQIVDVPTFTVATPTGAGIVASLDVAAGLDDAMLFAWIEASAGSTTERPALARHVSPTGATLGPLVRLDGGGVSLEPHIATVDRCTDMLDVVLPERTSAKGPRATKLTLKSRAETYGNESDGDKITLTCLP